MYASHVIKIRLWLFYIAWVAGDGHFLNASDHDSAMLSAAPLQRETLGDNTDHCPPCSHRQSDCGHANAVITSYSSNGTALIGDNATRSGISTEECPDGGAKMVDECGCCIVCIRAPNETCGGVHQQLGICQSGSVCWPILPSKGSLLNGTEVGVCVELFGVTCETPIESQGCNLDVKRGCVCSNVMACRPVEFQYADEDECRQGWRKLKAMWQEDCLKARCNVVFQPHCPPDSIFTPAPPPEPPECCQKPGMCQCSLTACQNNVLKPCPPGQELVLTKKATGRPGACCDVYECHSRGMDECSSVICPPVETGVDEAVGGDAARDDCPPDSFRPLSVRDNTCCPVKEECRCRPGLCEPANCPDGFHIVVRKKGAGVPGACCDEFECVDDQELATGPRLSTCEYAGNTFEQSDTWRPTPCIECECKDGVTLCRKLECPSSTCSHLVIPEGECCPVCIGCLTEDGERYNVTDEWRKDDCTSCSCEANGRIVCQKQLCKIECDHPVKMPGECCPKCDKPLIITLAQACPRIELCPLRCEFGLKRDDRGCFLCECQTGSDSSAVEHDHYNEISTMETWRPFPSARRNCSLFDGVSCVKKCAHGYDHDGSGCPLCKCRKCPSVQQCYKHCLYGLQTNVYGCTICKCKGNNLQPLLSSSESPSHFGSGPSDLSSSIDLAGCHSQMGGLREHGEWWFDGCRHCYCDNGLEYCSVLSCPPLNCTNPLYEPGDCCPHCLGSSQEGVVQRLICHAPGGGRSYVEGEYWELEPCIRCTCHVGHVLCHRQFCPPAPCPNPSLSTGQCCPLCEDTKLPELGFSSNGTFCQSDTSKVAYMDGSLWKTTPCESCICRDGRASCYSQQCPLTGCDGRVLQLKHECCPLCTGNLENGVCWFSDSIVYSVGEQWRDGPCRNCSCVGDGETLCTQVDCPRCSNATPVDGQCCPVCADDALAGTTSGRNVEWKSWGSVQPTSIGTRHPELADTTTYNSQTTLVLVSCVAGVLAVLVVILLLVCWYRKRTRQRSHQKNGCFNFLRRKKADGARLTKFPGYDPSKSVPVIVEERNNDGHEQMKTLLSTDANGNGDIMKNGNHTSHLYHPDILLSGSDARQGCPYDERESRAVKSGTLLYEYDIDTWDVEKV